MSTRYLRILIYAPLAVAFGLMAVVLSIAGTSQVYKSEAALNTQVGAAIVLSVIGVVGFLTSLPPRQDERGLASWVAIVYDLIIGVGGVLVGLAGALIILATFPTTLPFYKLFQFLQAYVGVFVFLGSVIGWRGLRQVIRRLG